MFLAVYFNLYRFREHFISFGYNKLLSFHTRG